MGQLDETLSNCVRTRLRAALAQAEKRDPDGVEAQTLRLVKCAWADRDVAARERGECSGCEDEELLSLLRVMVGQRERSAREYDQAGRILDAERERQEIEVIEAFLPKPLAGDDLDQAVQNVVSELEARKLKDMGRCMTALRQRYPGRIECGPAGKAVRAALG